MKKINLNVFTLVFAFICCGFLGSCNLEEDKKSADDDLKDSSTADDDDDDASQETNNDDDDDNDDTVDDDDDDTVVDDDDTVDDDDVVDDDDDEISDDDDYDNSCIDNSGCTIVMSDCCSCGDHEEDYLALSHEEAKKHAKRLDEKCEDIDCYPCPPSMPMFAPLAVCDGGECELRFVDVECEIKYEDNCIPSETEAVTDCPSNWGECGCTYSEQDVCVTHGAPYDCEYDDLGCPISCECVIPPEPGELPEIPDMYACITDSDCTEILSDCCSCGGASINIEYTNDWYDWLNETMRCDLVDCAPPDPVPCEAGVPVCHYGRCSLAEPTEEWRCEATECIIASACDCEKDLYGCTIQACVGRGRKCRGDADCGDGARCWYGDGCYLTPDGDECDPNGDGYCHTDCSGSRNSCAATENCYDVINSWGDVGEEISVCLDIY